MTIKEYDARILEDTADAIGFITQILMQRKSLSKTIIYRFQTMFTEIWTWGA